MILQLGLETHTTLDDVRDLFASKSQGTTLATNQEQGYVHLERVQRRS